MNTQQGKSANEFTHEWGFRKGIEVGDTLENGFSFIKFDGFF